MTTYSTCVFCDQNDSKPSKEDVLPKWIAKEFPRTHWQITPIHAIPTYRAKGNLGIIAKAPCERCNNGWMSQLEDLARPILIALMHGTGPSMLSVEAQFIIARWFLKTVVMFDCHGHKVRECYFNSEERRALMKSISVPQNTLFFLGRYRGEKDVIARETNLPIAFERATPNGNLSCLVRGYAATFAIKHLSLQVFSMQRPPEEFTDIELGLSIPGNWSDACIQIWPGEGDAKWPTPYYLDDEGFKLFTERWQTISQPSGGR